MITKEDIKDFNKILDICLKINNQGKYFAWFNFSGHVEWADVRITSQENTDTWLLSLNMITNKFGKQKDITSPKQAIEELQKYLIK